MSDILFIADVMLGSLARWLRIAGFDTLYYRHIDDRDLIRIAKQQQRILLTRDTNLTRRRMEDRFLLIHSEDTFEQLKEVLRALNIHELSFSPRCPQCNGMLEAVTKESVFDDVPDHVMLTVDSFFKCAGCGKVYWKGSHKRRIDMKMKELAKEIDPRWELSKED
ncbi:MAG: Mut7-C RNAse domain-containing protein [Nitrospirota bacterium]